MKIGIVATHSWPIPTPVHTGDIVILDLAVALHGIGHEVVMFAPAGTMAPGRLCEMRAGLGASRPLPGECELECYSVHRGELFSCDVVHDFSIEKNIAEHLMDAGRPVVSTLLGGNWARPRNGMNLCVWSNAMRERGLRGFTDYWNTPTPDAGGPGQQPVTDAHVVYGGIDTDFYCPDGYKKGDRYGHAFSLWMNRWHPVKGFRQAIESAKREGFRLVMSGEDPSYMRWDAEKDWAREAVELARGCDNISFEWLPPGETEHHVAKRDLYRRADRLLYPVQFQEPFGLSMAEAMACGTPVVGNSYGSVSEVTAGADSVGVPPERCREIAVSRFSRNVMANNYLSEYSMVLNGARWGGR